jgi:hypothetical protein
VIRLTDTQRIILSAASQRTDRLALPLPKNIKGGAALKVINPLIQRGLFEEVAANRKLGDPVWRETGDGHGVTLIITDAGLTAIGVEADKPDTSPQVTTHGKDAYEAATALAAAESKTAPISARRERNTRDGTKQALIIGMLRRPEGASIGEIAAATGWLQHTVRGAMAGTLKKKLGLAIYSEKDDEKGRVYRLASTPSWN